MVKIFKKSFLVTILGMSLFSGTIHAQDINVDSAKVRVTSGAFIVGTRNLIISNDSGLVNNSGTIYVSGNITNSGKIISDGVEVLNGTSNQTITGVHGNSYLGNVFRAQSANRNVIAGSSAVMRTFDFGDTNGFVDVSSSSGYSVRILNSTDTAIKNFSSTKYFDLGDNLGLLERTVATLDTLQFPVGNSTAGYRRMNYHPMNSQTGFVGLKVINGSPSSSPVPNSYLRIYSSGFGNSLTGSGCVPDSFNADVMFDCLTDHYWRLITPTNTAEYFVEVFNPACFDLAMGVGNRRVLRVPTTTPTNDWFSVANIEDVVDLPISDNFCLYSDWKRTRDTILGGVYRGGGLLAISSGIFYPLSVEFTSLTATAGESEIILDWETASEKNADRFEVLRSTDAVNFEKIGLVYAFGNSNTPRNYQFIDENVEPDVEYYYQLRQVDYNGQFTLSNVVSAQITSSTNVEITIFPNPTTGILKISQVVPEVSVFSLLGQQIGHYQNVDQISLDRLPIGIYIVSVGLKSYKVQKL